MVVLYLDINLFLIVVSPQLEQKGKLQRPIAKDVSEESCISLLNVPFFGGEFLFFSYLFFSLQLLPPDASDIRLLRGHKLPITCLVITSDEKYIFSASKDCSIIKCE